jgi:hypothetical protein
MKNAVSIVAIRCHFAIVAIRGAFGTLQNSITMGARIVKRKTLEERKH